MTLDDLVSDLKFNSQVQASEGYADPADYQRVIISAGMKHNSSYVITPTECTVPDAERPVLDLLAWYEFCLIRASKVANSPTLTAPAGFGTDRNTPFYKLLALARELLKQYQDLCASMGLDIYYGSNTGGSVASISEVTIEQYDVGGQMPAEISRFPDTPVLTVSPVNAVNPNGSLILSWTFKPTTNFASYIIFHLTGTDGIYQDWNFGSKAGTPKINDDAECVATINEVDCKSVKLLDLPIDSGLTNRFLVVAVSKSPRYSYSNEIVLLQP